MPTTTDMIQSKENSTHQKSQNSDRTKNMSERFQQKMQKSTGVTSPSKNKETRNAKRRRWAKKNLAPKVASKPVVQKPVKEYVSACCNVPATKPRCGEKFMAQDPDSGKMAESRKGLGTWRCGECKKPTKVTPRKPQEGTDVAPIN